MLRADSQIKMGRNGSFIFNHDYNLFQHALRSHLRLALHDSSCTASAEQTASLSSQKRRENLLEHQPALHHNVDGRVDRC